MLKVAVFCNGAFVDLDNSKQINLIANDVIDYSSSTVRQIRRFLVDGEIVVWREFFFWLYSGSFNCIAMLVLTHYSMKKPIPEEIHSKVIGFLYKCICRFNCSNEPKIQIYAAKR